MVFGAEKFARPRFSFFVQAQKRVNYHNMAPHLEKKNASIIPKKEDFGEIKDETSDEKKINVGINAF